MNVLIDRRAMLSILAVAFPGAALPERKETSGVKKRILVLCTGNSCRSQMTEGFLRSFDSGLEVYSAGTDPAPRVHPLAVRVMREVGIDISGGVPKRVDQFLDQPFDYVITVCDEAQESCPTFSGKVGKQVHIGFTDPAKATGTEEEVLAVFRRARDEIKAKFSDLYENEIRGSL